MVVCLKKEFLTTCIIILDVLDCIFAVLKIYHPTVSLNVTLVIQICYLHRILKTNIYKRVNCRFTP